MFRRISNMTFPWSILMLIQLGSTGNTSQRNGVPYLDTIFTRTIDPKLPPFQFHLRATLEKPDSLAPPGFRMFHEYTIVVLDSLSGDTIQTISDLSESNDLPEVSRLAGNYPAFTDINFDGFPDLKYLAARGATGNVYFSFWLYRPSLKKFIYSNSFSRLCNPCEDPRTKHIRTFEKCGWGCYRCYTYIVRGGNPIPISFLSVDPNSENLAKEGFHCKRGRIVAGKEIVLEKWDSGNEVFNRPELNPWTPETH